MRKFENISKPVSQCICISPRNESTCRRGLRISPCPICTPVPCCSFHILFFSNRFATPSHKVACVHLPSPLKKVVLLFFDGRERMYTTTGTIEISRTLSCRDTLVIDLCSGIFSMSSAKELLNCSVSSNQNNNHQTKKLE